MVTVSPRGFFFLFEYDWKSLGSHKLPYWGIMHLFRHEVCSKQFAMGLFGTAFGTYLFTPLFIFLFISFPPFLLYYGFGLLLWWEPAYKPCYLGYSFCGEPCNTWRDILSLWGPLWLQRERWAAWHEGQGCYLDLIPLVRHNRMPLSQLQLIAARIYFGFLFCVLSWSYGNPLWWVHGGWYLFFSFCLILFNVLNKQLGNLYKFCF